MAKVEIKNVLHNLHRDLELYGYIEPKLAIIEESFQKTGVWPNMVAVPMAYLEGDMTAEDVEKLNADLGVDGLYDGEVMIPWGHHRLEAMRRLNMELVKFNLVAIDEDQLLLQMIYENHDDYSGNMKVFLESIYQARKKLTEKIQEAGDYDTFRKEFPNVFKSKKAWEQMGDTLQPSSGAVKNFLGDTWDQYSIGYAFSAIDGIDEGLYTQGQVCAATTVRQMDCFDKLVREIYAQDAYPLYFKQKFVNEIADIMADSKKGLTVSQLTNARKNVKDSATNPVKSFKADMKKAFNLVQELDVELVNDLKDVGIDGLADHEGFKDFEGLAEVIKKIEKKRAKEAGEAGGGEAQDAVDGAGEELEEGEGASLEATEGTEGEDSARAEASEEIGPDEIVAGFVNTAGGFKTACETLNTLSDEQLEAAEGLVDAITEAMTALAAVGVRVTTKTSLKKLIG